MAGILKMPSEYIVTNTSLGLASTVDLFRPTPASTVDTVDTGGVAVGITLPLRPSLPALDQP